ncbi:hypothetical protein BD410DRAFT_773625, partial [Rickenella mellea]
MLLANGVYRIKNAQTKNYVTLLGEFNDLVAGEEAVGNRENAEWQVKLSDNNERCTIQNRAFGTFAGPDPEHSRVRGTEVPHMWEIKDIDDSFAIHAAGTVTKFWCFENHQLNSQVFLREAPSGDTGYQWILEGIETAEKLPLIQTSYVTRQSHLLDGNSEWEEILRVLSEKLPIMPETMFVPEHGCLQGTRTTLLKIVNEWTMVSDSICLLTGLTGAGKSAIAHSVALQAWEKGILGGCFFLPRNLSIYRDAHVVINSLAFQLAQFDLEIAKHIRNVLSREPDLVSSSNVHKKFSELIVKPVKQASDVKKIILLVIDDLDALNNVNAMYSDVRQEFLVCLA